MSNKSSVDEYILVYNDENILSNDINDDFIKIDKCIIPEPPQLPVISDTNIVNLKVRIRYQNFNQYKKTLKRKRQRKRRHNY